MESSYRSPLRVDLLGGFRLQAGNDQVTLSNGAERLLAFVALCRPRVPRNLIAGTLWPNAPERRAAASLRSALARLNGAGRQMLDVGATEIRLSPDTEVDIDHARSLAHRILDRDAPTRDDDLSPAAVSVLSSSLLPGWYDDWVLVTAEEWHQQRLHALEALAADFVRAGRHADAVAAATVAVHADPLRESACAALIQAHLAEGNQAEALHHFKRYEQRLQSELRLQPTPRLRALVADLQTAGRQAIRSPTMPNELLLAALGVGSVALVAGGIQSGGNRAWRHLGRPVTMALVGAGFMASAAVVALADLPDSELLPPARALRLHVHREAMVPGGRRPWRRRSWVGAR
ncbi:AfsR/SARP family transcriptional regulator [Nonomuraea africana]|uniref:DNA-binding SARP family transcriptional activator n=1 Tax=Nonomuraea africana TaxID=46171 RepID=A0ABR9KRL9_9ACTN|nr:BTAD domain-containing putative transcriptional regulator [Nonomuraea africana]MBE1564667.1 DNA-binding SARP family transcriptional activator [Nonomuraea africana]